MMPLLIPAQAQEVRAFKDAYAHRKADCPREKPDPAIVKAMDILIERIERTPKNADVAKVLAPFAKTIARKDASSTEYANVGGSISRGYGRQAIAVWMGGVSRMRVFDVATGKPVPLPKIFDWQDGYDTIPTILPGGKIVVDSPGIRDAGARYDYRVWFLSTKANALKTVKRLEGTVCLDDPGDRFKLHGHTLVLDTFDDPKSFNISQSQPLFRRVMTYDLSGAVPTLRKTSFDDPTLKAVDDWIARAVRSPKTGLQRRVAKTWGKDRMNWEYQSSKATKTGSTTKLELNVGDKFVFTLRNGQVVDFTHTKQ